MFQNKTVFFEYPSLYLQGSFDKVCMDFYLEREKPKVSLEVYYNSGLVAKFAPYVPLERLFDQYALEQEFAEQNGGRGIKYELKVYGSFPKPQQN